MKWKLIWFVIDGISTFVECFRLICCNTKDSVTEWSDTVPRHLIVLFYNHSSCLYLHWNLHSHPLLPPVQSSKTTATPSTGGSLVIAIATCVLPRVISIIQAFTAMGDEDTSKMLGGQVYYFTFLHLSTGAWKSSQASRASIFHERRALRCSDEQIHNYVTF